jgi:hypothetical protein
MSKGYTPDPLDPLLYAALILSLLFLYNSLVDLNEAARSGVHKSIMEKNEP